MHEELEKIPVFKPYIGPDTIEHLSGALEVGWLGMGSYTKEFEDRISEFLQLKDRQVVATNTGTSALHLALVAAGVGPGDEVITPSFNYVADQQAILMSGAEVVMCDIDEKRLGIDCEKAEALIGERTKAIMPLHFAGIPCDSKGVYDLAKKYSLRVIEDGTHAFGSEIGGKKIGTDGDIACFSFDPVKIISSVDGGCVISPNPEVTQKLQRLRLLGVDKDTTERYKNKRAWDYDVVSEGYRYHLNNIMASFGISQIKRIQEFIESRRATCMEYNRAFSQIAEVQTPATDYVGVSPFIYYLRVKSGKRSELIAHMQKKNIDVGIHFIPVHKHTHFLKCKTGNLDVTNKVVEEILTLPLHSLMALRSVKRVIEAVSEFFGKKFT